MSKMTIIVPVYNELGNMLSLELKLANYIFKSPLPCKVLFIDDGSTDGSFAAIKDLCIHKEGFNYIHFPKNQGLSAALKAGIDNVDTEYVGYIDADLQTDVNDFNLLLEYIEDYDAVVGYRTKRKDSFNKKVQSFIVQRFRKTLINDGIIDTCCPLKVIRTSIAQNIPFFDGMHRFLPALIQLQGGTVKQIAVKHFKRQAGQSKFNIFNRSIKPLHDAFAYRWMKKRHINYQITQKLIS
ncbi:MAG: glycosyltransferase family 2 protein [Carboxylicivirga sp.]|jgi:glycosyltransferase involved in cell wall biosynthesis|nr:glycosyltransferase family 2 protein [Carboxylicivirga sp.]